MAIWSLTQERVEKLQRQIGDKEEEIDALQKLSPKDLWTRDLEEFVAEWNLQLEDEAKHKKKMAGLGRRDSRKLGIGAKSGGKRKKKRANSDSDSDEFSDYGPAKKKAKPKTGGLLSYLKKDPDEPTKKSEPSKPVNTKQTGLLNYLDKPSPAPADDAMDVDEPAPAPVVVSKRGRPAATKNVKKATPAPVDSESDSDVFAAVAKEASKKPTETVTNGRVARGATRKAANYAVDRDSDSDAMSDDDFDVSTMVKTIGGSGNDRPLFSAPTARRPGGATNGTLKANGRAKPTLIDDDDMDETNYEALAQGSPEKSLPRNTERATDLNDPEDSDDDLLLSIKKKAPVKPVPKAKAGAKIKAPAPSTVVAKKTTQLSPAAKAYAARLGKTKDVVPPKSKAKKHITVDSDEDEDEDEMMDDADKLANDILSDEDEDESVVQPKKAPVGRPGRRAAAKPAKYVVDHTDEDLEESEESSDFDDDSE